MRHLVEQHPLRKRKTKKPKRAAKPPIKTFKTKNGAPCGGHRPPPTPFPRDKKEREQRTKRQKQKDPEKPRVMRPTARPAQKKEKDQAQKNKEIRHAKSKSSTWLQQAHGKSEDDDSA